MQMQHINPFNFGPACDGEPLAFGAQAPESIRVKYWVDGMKTRGIKRVICLLPDAEIDDVYTLQPIREIYKREFGEDNICWAGILEGRVINLADIQDLANMPPKEQIYAKLLYLINAPAQRLVSAISGVGRNVAVVLDQGVKENKFSS